MRMKRREFIMLLGGAAVAWPLHARAQQPALPVIGYLGIASPETFAGRLRAFRLGLGEIGYVEGRNVVIEYRWAEGRYDRLPALAADLVRRQVTVMVAPGGIPSALAAKAATATIPIVFETGADPVAVGLVPSLNRPGGNITGVTSLNSQIEPKRLELLHELVPAATTIARLVNPTNPRSESDTGEVRAAARALGLQVLLLQASNNHDIDAAFATLVKPQAGALMIGADPLFNTLSEQLAGLAARYALPAIAQPPEFPAAGGLMSYGGSITESHRQAGIYVGRILKGEKPADLPVQQVTKVELILNLKAAKALGLSVPLPLLTRADEVIE
jgi:putative ABC transport system substrate-binding protein